MIESLVVRMMTSSMMEPHELETLAEASGLWASMTKKYIIRA